MISEVLLICIVALIVIKPEQLPDVAFKLGKLFKQLKIITAKFQAMFNTAKPTYFYKTILNESKSDKPT